MDPTRPANRLARETSPYLLQHAHNPVDWYPWGEEALARARAEDKPIFLSIGYSSCHWCHVMERESFENETIAAFLNDRFVSIKVDREERPDLDEVYMRAVQLMTGHGGWPMSVFLTPTLEPFYGGTYFPPVDRYGRPGFLSLLHSLDRHYRENREAVARAAQEMRAELERQAGERAAAEPVTPALLEGAVHALERLFDADDGGFGDAPKFPHAMDLRLLLRLHARAPRDALLRMTAVTLEKMARGGIHDQLGGGFHRYSTDAQWLIPHFEKMLYDNALLAPAYAEGWHVTGEPMFARIARDTCDYLLRDLVTPEGAFASAEDADSEGEEGRFYVWTAREIREALGADAERFAAYFGVEEGGNFEQGTNALAQVGPESARAALAGAIRTLLERRARRPRPLKDDKVIVEWNALAISGLADVGRLLDEPRFVRAAERAAAFVLDRMRRPDGRLLRIFRAGEARIDAFLPDYANLVQALLDLAQVSPDPRWLRAAVDLDALARERFAAGDGTYATTAHDQEAPLGRARDAYDNAVPSGNSVMALNQLRLAEITGDPEAHERAMAVLRAFAAEMRRVPAAFGQMLQAVELALHPPVLVVIVGEPGKPDFEAFRREVGGRFRPGTYVVLTDGGEAERDDGVAALRGRGAVGGKATAYVCRERRCLAPTSDLADLKALLAAEGVAPIESRQAME